MKYIENKLKLLYNMDTTDLYLYYKSYIGSFWALYLIGLRSIFDLKYTLSIMIIQMILGLLTSYLSNELLLNYETIEINNLIISIIICNLEGPILKIIDLYLGLKCNEERRIISVKTTNWILKIFNESSYKWKRENPDNTQREAIDNIFYTYMGITSQIVFLIRSLINTLSFKVNNRTEIENLIKNSPKIKKHIRKITIDGKNKTEIIAYDEDFTIEKIIIHITALQTVTLL